MRSLDSVAPLRSVFIRILLLLFILFLCGGAWGQEDREKFEALKAFTPGQLDSRLKTATGDAKTRILLTLAGKILETAPEKSLAYSQAALQRAQQSGKPFYILLSLNNLGNYYHVTNRFPEAIRCYLQALELESDIQDKKWVANLYTNIGMIYWNLEQYRKAEEYQRRGLEIRKKIKPDYVDMAKSLNNLGLALVGQEKGEEALQYYFQALEFYRNAGQKRGMAAVLNNIAGVYQETLKNYSQALDYYRQTIPLFEELKNEWGVANAHLNIGSNYVLGKQFQKARPYLEKALQKAEKIQAQRIIYYVYRNFFESYRDDGDYRAALEYAKKYQHVRDSFFNQETSREIDGLLARYEAEKREKELRLLRKANEIRSIIKVFLVVALLLVLVVSVVLYSRHHARERANLLLQQGEARYRAMFDHAGDAIFLMENATVIDHNNKAREMFGEDLEPIGKALAGRPSPFFWQHVKKDGTPFEAQVIRTPVTIGQRSLIQVVIHDITHRKRLEEERIKSVRLETTILMAGGIAHDFNNLLAILQGNLEMAKLETEPGSAAFLSLARMEKAIRSAGELVGKFRSMAEGGVLPKRVLSIGDILREALDSVMKKTGPAGPPVKFHLDTAPGVLPVEGYPGQLRRVFENLLVNALEAVGDQGEIRVSAAVVELSDGDVPPLPAGGYVNVLVVDNGEGIPVENLEKIYEPCFTTRGDSTGKVPGMGLTVAAAIIKRHNGAIKVTSEPGQGTTFSIYIPSCKDGH